MHTYSKVRFIHYLAVCRAWRSSLYFLYSLYFRCVAKNIEVGFFFGVIICDKPFDNLFTRQVHMKKENAHQHTRVHSWVRTEKSLAALAGIGGERGRDLQKNKNTLKCLSKKTIYSKYCVVFLYDSYERYKFCVEQTVNNRKSREKIGLMNSHFHSYYVNLSFE